MSVGHFGGYAGASVHKYGTHLLVEGKKALKKNKLLNSLVYQKVLCSTENENNNAEPE